MIHSPRSLFPEKSISPNLPGGIRNSAIEICKILNYDVGLYLDGLRKAMGRHLVKRVFDSSFNHV